MAQISEKDRGILRELAARQRDFATSAKNDEILKKWDALANSRRESPTVRLLYSNFTDEVVGSRMRCEGDAARSLEWQLLSTMVGRELFDDDTPISPTFDVGRSIWASPFGARSHTSRREGMTKGFHIDPVINDYAAEIDKLRGGKRRPCCFDLSSCTDPELARSGKLIAPEAGQA